MRRIATGLVLASLVVASTHESHARESYWGVKGGINVADVTGDNLDGLDARVQRGEIEAEHIFPDHPGPMVVRQQTVEIDGAPLQLGAVDLSQPGTSHVRGGRRGGPHGRQIDQHGLGRGLWCRHSPSYQFEIPPSMIFGGGFVHRL